MAERYILRLVDLSLSVHLGCIPEERAQLQEVRVSLEMRLDSPKACATDRLGDTVCYSRLCEAIRGFSSKTSFETVERLGQGCYEVVKHEVPHGTGLRLALHKVRPPVDSLRAGVVFEIQNESWQ